MYPIGYPTCTFYLIINNEPYATVRRLSGFGCCPFKGGSSVVVDSLCIVALIVYRGRGRVWCLILVLTVVFFLVLLGK